MYTVFNLYYFIESVAFYVSSILTILQILASLEVKTNWERLHTYIQWV